MYITLLSSFNMVMALIVIIGAVLLRLVPHLPNFVPITAMGLFGGAYFSKKYAILIPLIAMAVSDYLLLYINPYQTDFSRIQPVTAMFHSTTAFVWGSVLISGLIGIWLKKHLKPGYIIGSSLLGSIQFFIITNFGVWAGGYYGYTFPALLETYVQGVPFFRYTLAGDLFYTAVFFGSYALALRIQKRGLFKSV